MRRPTADRCRLIVLALPLVAAALLSPAQAQTGKGKKFALLVGVREYRHSKLDNLEFTENDVEELAEALRGGFAEVVLLTSTRGGKDAEAAPTARNIRAHLKRLLDKVSKHDTILVALAGHGLQLKVKVKDGTGKETETEEGFFCPADAKPRDDVTLAEQSRTMIGFTELFKELDESGVGVKLLLVDACRNDPKAGRSVNADVMPRAPQGLAALFSCRSGERAFESPKLGKGHGVFFFHVLEGLRKAKNERGEVTWDRLAEHVKEKVSDDVPILIGGGARQTPEEIKKLVGKAPVLLGPAKEPMLVGPGKGPPARAAAKYEHRADHDPDGIGKFYMGREIAQVMGHAAAGWLDRPERVKEEGTDKLLKALALKPGMVVADVGAGSGYFSFPMAQQVGPKGKVLAVDIQQEMLDLMASRMKARKVSNIELIKGTLTDPRLPEGKVDLVLLVDVYHELSHPYEMTEGMVKALKVGGKVVFVEYRKEDPNVPIKLLHKMTQSQVKKEMAIHPLKHVKTLDVLPWQHVILFEKTAR
jgi:ubiquinone/menaquinone biosynthesis C-methylase UbiE